MKRSIAVFILLGMFFGCGVALGEEVKENIAFDPSAPGGVMITTPGTLLAQLCFSTQLKAKEHAYVLMYQNEEDFRGHVKSGCVTLGTPEDTELCIAAIAAISKYNLHNSACRASMSLLSAEEILLHEKEEKKE